MLLKLILLINLTNNILTFSDALLKPKRTFFKQNTKVYKNVINTDSHPNKLSKLAKSKIVALASSFSLYGLFLGNNFMSEEVIINKWKIAAISKYIDKGMNVLEIGIGEGVGANFDYYPSDITLTGIDPYSIKEDNIDSSKSRYKQKGIDLNLYNIPCEKLKFPANSFDIVVSTLVLCSVRDVEKSISEVIRVLRPGGYFICQEHIHGEANSNLAFQQDLFDPVQQLLADGCHLTRETEKILQENIDENISSSNRFKNKSLMFSKVVEREIVLLQSHWPISRQMFAIYQK